MFEFSSRMQTLSSWLSLVVALSMLVLGVGLLMIPKTVFRLLLVVEDQEDEDHRDSHPSEVIFSSISRMVAGLVLAQSISCLILLFPGLWASSSSSSDDDIRMESSSSSSNHNISSTRLSICIQGITGLCWFVIGLMDDRQLNVEKHHGDLHTTSGLLLMGFCTFVLSSIAMMFSFCPKDSMSTTIGNESERRAEIETTTENSMMEPLLTRSPDEVEQEQLREEESDVPPSAQQDDPVLQDEEEASDVLNERPADIVENTEESTSRVQGTVRLLKLAKPQVMYLYIGCITLLIRLPFSICIPHFVSTTLVALTQGDYHKGRHEVFWLFVLGSVDAFLDFWCIFWFGYANLRISRGLRIDTFAAILKQDIGFFDKHTSGELASRLGSDCGSMTGDLTWFFRFSIESIVRIFGVTTYMVLRSPKLAACTLSILPIVASINKVYGNWLGENAREAQNALTSANAVAQETFSCVRTVIAFAAERFEYDKYVVKIDEQYRLNVKQTYLTGIYYMFVSTFLINTVVQGTLLLYGSYLIQKGQLSGEVLLAFMLYQGQLQNEMMNLFQSYSSLMKSSGAGDKVFALLDREPPPPATGNASVQSHSLPVPATSEAISIELQDLSFAYPSRPTDVVLMSFNLKVSAGQTVALVGPSGCGKSTIAGLLQRFYDPSQGGVFFDGIDLRTLDIKGHRDRIGVVTQDPVLFSGSILSNITYGIPTATMEQAMEAAKMANAHNFIMNFPHGYNTEVGERGTQLSGGQKQRLAIARAIIRKPSLLLLDEATSALDNESEKMVQDALDSLLSQSQEITTIVIAHRLGTVRNADAIAVINDGKIVELGDHEALMKIEKGYYREMVQKSRGDTLVSD